MKYSKSFCFQGNISSQRAILRRKNLTWKFRLENFLRHRLQFQIISLQFNCSEEIWNLQWNLLNEFTSVGVCGTLILAQVRSTSWKISKISLILQVMTRAITFRQLFLKLPNWWSHKKFIKPFWTIKWLFVNLMSLHKSLPCIWD